MGKGDERGPFPSLLFVDSPMQHGRKVQWLDNHVAVCLFKELKIATRTFPSPSSFIGGQFFAKFKSRVPCSPVPDSILKF